ncbi:hypothetical protein CsNV_073 [Callinectes sapidus nudivirus]|nr:hypothetical protein CsNV_073 [Callinectes sapidus nudivirus]
MTTENVKPYDLNLTKFENMKRFHNSIPFINKWAVYVLLRTLFDEVITFTVDDHHFSSLTEICYKLKYNNNSENRIKINRKLSKIMTVFTNTYMPHMNVEDFESFVLCNTFLQCMLEENIKRFPVMMANFKHTKLFLQSIHLLYMQKFNATKVKILFGPVFYNDVFEKFKHDDVVMYDIFNVLAGKTTNAPITVNLQRLKPYQHFINNYAVRNVSDDAIISAVSNFTTGNIISVPDFYNLCNSINKESHKKYTITNLKMFSKTSAIKDCINKLNPQYGNLLLLVLLKLREDSTTHHKDLYKNLIECL